MQLAQRAHSPLVAGARYLHDVDPRQAVPGCVRHRRPMVLPELKSIQFREVQRDKTVRRGADVVFAAFDRRVVDNEGLRRCYDIARLAEHVATHCNGTMETR